MVEPTDEDGEEEGETARRGRRRGGATRREEDVGNRRRRNKQRGRVRRPPPACRMNEGENQTPTWRTRRRILDPTFERQEGAAIPTPTSRMTQGNGEHPADVKRHEGMEDPTLASNETTVDTYWSRAWLCSFLFRSFYIIFDVLTHKPKEGWSFLGNINIYFQSLL